MSRLQITLGARLTEEDLLSAHDNLSRATKDDEVVLSIGEEIGACDPLTYSRLMLLIVTWGRSLARPVLQLWPASIDVELAQLFHRSNHLLVAAALADDVMYENGASADLEARAAVEALLEIRNSLDGEQSDHSEQTLTLPAHIPRLDHSPELHALTSSGWGVGEEARTLYHRLWPEPDKPITLRDPRSDLNEVRRDAENGTPYIARMAEPDSKVERITLGERAYKPRGKIRELVTEHRAREKTLQDELGEILFELVQNTQTHGRVLSDAWSGRAFRVVSFREWEVSPDSVDADLNSDDSFKRYLDNLTDKIRTTTSDSPAQITFAAISIIDSGIGLAKSAANSLGEGHLCDGSNEVYYLMAAMESSIRVSVKSMGNIGLPRVQLLMSNLLGYMAIGSGRLEIRRDFVKHPIEVPTPINRNVKPRFIDWVPEKIDEFDLGDRIGTAITLVLPVDFRSADGWR